MTGLADGLVRLGDMGGSTFAASGLTIPKSVTVSFHTVERMRSRFPELKEFDSAALCALARREVTAALGAGRLARNQPTWTLFHQRIGRGGRGRRKKAAGASGKMRYAWNETETRAYIIERKGAVVRIITAVGRVRPILESQG